MTSECPVCYAVMESHSDYLDGWCLLEHYEHCPHGCFDYEFAHGNTRTYVTIRGHHLEFDAHYTDSPKTARARGDAIDIAIGAARRALIEDLRNELLPKS